MQKTLFKFGVIFTLIALFSLPQQGNAFGIGIYIPAFGTGSVTYSYTNSYDTYESEYDTRYAGGLGIVLDTRVARNGVFNYRLNLGFYNATNIYSSDWEYEDFKFYVMDHSFGFGVVRTRLMRIWIGPQVRLAYHTQPNDDSLIGFGLGPVLGANFNFGRVFTVALDLGYRVSAYAGTSESEDEYGYGSETETFTRTENLFFINLSVLFRLGDVFERAYDDADDDKPDYDEEYY